jgi:hypothetical protein
MIRLVTGLTTILLLLTACGRGPESIEDFESMAHEVEQHAAAIAAEQQEIRAILQSYNQTVPAARRLRLDIDPDCGLGEAALGTLSERIDSEPDESCRGLLERIAEIQKDIAHEQELMREITDQLRSPHRVRPGENHYTLCVTYLTTQHGLSHEAADSLVARIALNGDIIEGFHVWFFYERGMFGTFVTQGEAHISPAVFAKVVKRQLLEQAQRQGQDDTFETIVDSLNRSGALLANFKHGMTGL